MTRFGSIEEVLDYVCVFCDIPVSQRAEIEFEEVALLPETAARIREPLHEPRCFKFSKFGAALLEKEHTIVVDSCEDGSFACWYVNGKGFGRKL